MAQGLQETKFNLQEYLCSKDGDKWLSEVKVNDQKGTSFRYYAPPVAWEDINRHENKSIGDFIFDVTIKIKPNNKTGTKLSPHKANNITK
eukprot:689107_1